MKPGTPQTDSNTQPPWPLDACVVPSSIQNMEITAGLTSLATAVRWATITLGLIISATLSTRVHDMIAGLVLITWALWRTFRPIAYRAPGWKGLLPILFESVIAVGVITSTRCWDSPYLFTMFAPTIAAGFARGFWHSLRIGLACAIAVSVAADSTGSANAFQPISTWSLELILTSALASFGKRLLMQAERERAISNSRMERLNETNAMLVHLNTLASDLSASFDVQESVNSTLREFEELTQADDAAILLVSASGKKLHTEAIIGKGFGDSYEIESLPDRLKSTLQYNSHVILHEYANSEFRFSDDARTALYVPLWVLDRPIGVVVLEAKSTVRFSAVNRDSLKELANTVSFVIDNAKWFDRLRARGAAQERMRIARDLHDRVSQGIAYIAFELERIARAQREPHIQHDLLSLHADTKSIVSELRETLHDLRSDVNESQRITRVIAEFADRVTQRAGIAIVLELDETNTIDVARERECWRIAQEAIVNAEKHAHASEIQVTWHVNAHAAELTVSDNGVGISTPAPGTDHARRYGIIGMRERAESIGATLQVGPGTICGTVVSLSVPIGNPNAEPEEGSRATAQVRFGLRRTESSPDSLDPNSDRSTHRV